MADTTTPVPSPLTIWHGRLLLKWARLLQRTVAGKHRRQAHVARRNAAMRGAHARGQSREDIARAVGLGGEQVRKALRGEMTTE